MDASVKQNVKSKNLLEQNIQEIGDTNIHAQHGSSQNKGSGPCWLCFNSFTHNSFSVLPIRSLYNKYQKSTIRNKTDLHYQPVALQIRFAKHIFWGWGEAVIKLGSSKVFFITYSKKKSHFPLSFSVPVLLSHANPSQKFSLFNVTVLCPLYSCLLVAMIGSCCQRSRKCY